MANSDKSPFEVTDFSGGITDDVYEQRYNCAETLDNFFITSDGKLKSRPGSQVDVIDELNGQIPDGVARIGTLINYNNSSNLLVHSTNKIFFRDPEAYSTLQGPTGNEALNIATDTQALSYSQWNRHVYITSDEYPNPVKVYKDSSGNFQVRSSGLPPLATAPNVVAGTAGANDYLYAFHYEYTYTAGPQTFEDVGQVTFVSLASSGDPSVNANNISVIPVLSNGSNYNWDTANIKVFIYRSISGGTTLYKIGEVTNGTTTFVDNFSDSSIQTNLVLYTDDGTLDFDPTPVSKFVHVVNSTGYYASIKTDTDEFPFRIRQSIPGDPDSCPEDFFKDLEDDIMGISSVKSIPLVFCKRHVYRLENNFDQFGRGDINAVRISDTAGCVSNLSIVQAENYVFWAGNDGFYSTDGYQVIKISDGFNTLYKNILEAQSQQTRVYGKFDETERRVFWGIQQSANSLDNDSVIILDLRWGVKDKSTFKTWSGSGTNFRPTALEFFNKKLYRADTRGYVFVHDDSYTTDPKVNTLETVDLWDEVTVIWTYKSININFGSSFFRKMPTRILLTAGNVANTSIQITAINDDNKVTRPLKLIRWRKVFTWGDEDFVWGNQDCVWNQTGLIEQWRRFPAKNLRLSYVQIIVTNGYSVVTNSDTSGLAAFVGGANTATLSAPSTWPAQSIDYFISTEVDNYVTQYQVIARTSDTVLTVADPGNNLPTGSFKWLLQGYKKGEPLHLISYNIHWANASQTQDTYHSGDSGDNA